MSIANTPEFVAIQRRLVDALMRLPAIDDFAFRSTLLYGLSAGGLNRAQNSAKLDLNQMIHGLAQLGRLRSGVRPLVVMIDNAEASVGSEYAEVVDALREAQQQIEALYGGDAQPTVPRLPASERENLIFGQQRDTRLTFAFIEGARVTARAVARLTVPRIFAGRVVDPPAYGTGWLIAPSLLLTNHHVVTARDSREPPPTDEDLRAQTGRLVADFDFVREGSSAAVTCSGATLLAANAVLDYALVELAEGSKVDDRAPLAIVPVQPRLRRGDRLNIVQHPKGGAVRFAIRNNFFVCPGATDTFLRYQTDTEAGSSGSPVCNDSWQVVGLHHGVSDHDGGSQTVPQEVISGHPVMVWILNEATAIHSILADLPAALRERIQRQLLSTTVNRPPSIAAG